MTTTPTALPLAPCRTCGHDESEHLPAAECCMCSCEGLGEGVAA